MKIDKLHSGREKDMARVAATVTWESCNLPTRELYIETDARFASSLVLNPNAFLLACILPAMRHGEERILIDDEICPELRNGLEAAMSWLHKWYGPPRKAVRIESRIQAHPPSPVVPRAGSFLSGGIDSLAILRTNRLDFPAEHPLSIKDCLFVHGFDIGGYEGLENQFESFELAKASLATVARDAKVTLIPVYTNIRHLDDDLNFWVYEFHGAALSAVAHAFSCRLNTIFMASGGFELSLMPADAGGSHPFLVSNYSGAGMQIRTDTRFTRLDRVRIVGEWDVGLQNIRVCPNNMPNMLNCGKCEKCIRTMLELLAVGKLGQTSAFPTHILTVEMVKWIFIESEHSNRYYNELIEPLTKMGYSDLAQIFRKRSAQYVRYLKWKDEKDWKGLVKRFDRRCFGSRLIKLRETWRSNRCKRRRLMAGL